VRVQVGKKGSEKAPKNAGEFGAPRGDNGEVPRRNDKGRPLLCHLFFGRRWIAGGKSAVKEGSKDDCWKKRRVDSSRSLPENGTGEKKMRMRGTPRTKAIKPLLRLNLSNGSQREGGGSYDEALRLRERWGATSGGKSGAEGNVQKNQLKRPSRAQPYACGSGKSYQRGMREPANVAEGVG